MRVQREQDPRVLKLRDLYRKHGRSALVLTRNANLTWLLGGRTWVGTAGDTGLCKAVINDSGVYVLTNNIEGERLRREEFGDGPEFVITPWQDSAAAEAAQWSLAGENPLVDTTCENEMFLLRTVLLPEQEEEARQVALLCGRAVTQVVEDVKPGMTEFEISGCLCRRALSLGLQPIVLFTPVDEHIATYRHALSGERKLEKLVMLSMGANKNGVHASITRFLSFGAPSKETLLTQDRAYSVAAHLYTTTRPGVSYSDLYHEMELAYANAGCPEQLALHHQGGPGGFQVRETRLMPDSPLSVHAHQIYAWNPSVTGFKSEDMLLVGETENSLLTLTPDFPHKDYVAGNRVWTLPQILSL